MLLFQSAAGPSQAAYHGAGKEQAAIGRHPRSSSGQAHRRGSLCSSALLMVLVLRTHASMAVAFAGMASSLPKAAPQHIPQPQLQIPAVEIPTPRWTVQNSTELLTSPKNLTDMSTSARKRLFTTVQAKAMSLTANISNPPPSPVAVLSDTPVPPSPPTPVAPVPPPQKTAVRATLRITGPDVTPFGPANQQRLINVLADASQNISQSAFRIILVTDAYTFRRHLQQLANVADVTIEVNAGTANNAPVVMQQISSMVVNNSIAISLQQHGLTDWSMQLLSIATVVPSSTTQSLPCQARFGKFCLDGTIWNVAAITMIIAFGSATVVVIGIALFVMREVRRRSGVTGELEMPKVEMSATRMERMRRFVLGRPLAEVNGAASSPVDRPPLTPPKKARAAAPRK